ncbi:MAG: hypothetical protein M3431_05870, partial [Actinomycetota bacterium]|nr:hypothetical protein [Actinomycetota bacterium]
MIVALLGRAGRRHAKWPMAGAATTDFRCRSHAVVGPLRDAFDGVCVRDEAVSRIAPKYRRLIGVYLAAQGGR